MARRAFVIERSTWHRGQGADTSYLLVPATGKMCCLGSIALQAGAEKDQILNQESPASLRQKGTLPVVMLPLVDDGLAGFRRASNSAVCGLMMEANDMSSMADDHREIRLTELAATIGWDLTFTD